MNIAVLERTLRIGTGLILFLFVMMHLLNVGLGVISAELIEQTRPAFMYFWSSFIGKWLLMLSMIVHMALGIRTLYRRNTLSMSAADTLQFASGFIIFPLLFPHVWGVIAMGEILNTKPDFTVLLRYFWIDSPLEGLRQVLVITVVWVHGCIGIFTWLRIKTWWPRIAPFVYPLVVIIPVLSLLGFIEGGNYALQTQDTISQSQESAKPELTDEQLVSSKIERKNNLDFINSVKWISIYAYLGILALVLLARFYRLRRKRGKLHIIYSDGYTIQSDVGQTILEIAQLNSIPHANLCRGRGRCGTCRVKIIESSGELSEKTDLESTALELLMAGSDERLACQCVPGQGTLKIEKLVPSDITPKEFQVQRKKLFDAKKGLKQSGLPKEELAQ